MKEELLAKVVFAFLEACAQEIIKADSIATGSIKYLHRPGYPLAGCSPAEPDSVWPGNQNY